MSGSDTIAAIATAPGPSGVAVVRVSGPEACRIGERLAGKSLTPGRFGLARFRDPLSQAVIDEGIVLYFRAPNSYTGEEVVEFQGHGGTVTPRRLLEACLKAGARLARRGEFTERAFLNGKLDYDQAESVLNLIEAKTERAADAALAGLSGRRQRELQGFYASALAISTELEHALDVDESDLPVDFFETQRQRLLKFRDDLTAALRRAREGKILHSGALVVLAGAPNVGKSSLMNALLSEDRAIVSATPGTTRDVLEEWLDLSGWPIRLVDTAGLRETNDAIEAEGVRRAEKLIDCAQVVLSLTDGKIPEAVDERTLVVRTKGDLLSGSEADFPASVLVVSARTGAGLSELKRAIVDRLERLSETSAIADSNDSEVLKLAEVVADLNGIEREGEIVLVANRVRTVARHLGRMLGADYSEDLLERLFSRFCVGK